MIHRIISIILLCISALGLHAQTLTPEILFRGYSRTSTQQMVSNNHGVVIVIQENTPIVRSSDSGKNWHKVNLNRNSTGQGLVFLDSSHCLISDTNTKGSFFCLYSDDAGLTWSESNVTYPDTEITASHNFIPMNDSTCLSVSDSGYVYLTTDFGKNWQYKSTIDKRVSNFAGRSVSLGESVLFISDSLCFRSSDTGSVWNEVTRLPIKGTYMYHNIHLGTVNVLMRDSINQVYTIFSTDMGETWEAKEVYPNVPKEFVVISYTPKKTIAYAPSVSINSFAYILSSEDNWKTWDSIQTNEYSDLIFSSIMTNDTTALLGGIERAIYSIDLAHNKSEKISGVRINEYNRCQIGKDFITFFDFDGNIAHSTYEGAVWNPCNRIQQIKIPADVYFLTREKGFVIGNGEQNGFFKTTDGGNTWIDMSVQLGEGFNGSTIRFIDSMQGLVSVRDQEKKSYLLSTSDGGNTWSKISMDTNMTTQTFDFKKVGDNTLIAITGEMDRTKLRTPVLISENYGKTWTRNYIRDTFYTQSVQIADEGVIYISSEKFHGNKSVTYTLYRSSDSGLTWENIVEKKREREFGNSTITSHKSVVILTYPESDSIVLSNDYGKTWKSYQHQIFPKEKNPQYYIMFTTIKDDTLYMCGNLEQVEYIPIKSLYPFLVRFVLPKEITTSVEHETTVNEKNYTNLSVAPNPADETVSVHLQMNPQELRATTLTLFSEQGVLIRDLTSELIKSDTYCSIETNTLSSGIYFLTIRSNTFSQTVPVAILH